MHSAAGYGTGNLGVAATASLVAFWLAARVELHLGPKLPDVLLAMQFALLASVLIFSIVTHGMMTGITAMIAASAISCVYALLRLAAPGSNSGTPVN